MKKLSLLLLFSALALQANAQLWSGAQGDSAGWKYLDWLGWFWSPSEDAGWFYLENQGWAYTDATSTDSMFIFYNDWQWTWTNDSHYPWSFNTSVLNGDIDWQYYLPGSFSPTLYFSDGSQFWRTGPFDFLGNLDYGSMVFGEFEEIQNLGNLTLLHGDTTTYGLGDGVYRVDGGIGPFPLLEKDTELAALEVGTVLTEESKQLTFKIDIPPMLEGKAVDLIILGQNVELIATNTAPVGSTLFVLSKDNDVLEVNGVGEFNGASDYAAYADLPAFETFQAESGETFFNIYEGEFLARGLVYFIPFLRYDPGNGEEIVLYSTSKPGPQRGSVQVNFQFTEPTPALEGNIVAQTDFRPTPNGFGFPNFGSTTDFLDAEDVYMLMGEEYVISDNGTFTFTAKGCNWLSSVLSNMAGGHCFGISATVVRLLDGLPYRGKELPGDYQPGATEAIQLQLENVQQVISFWMASQFNPNVFNAVNATTENGLQWVIDSLIDDMNGDREVVSIVIEGKIDGNEAGHAITPYAIEQVNENVYRIRVWDNNYPAYFTNFIEVDLEKGTWAYSSQLTGQTWYSGGFNGTNASDTLGFTTMRAIEMIANPPSSDPNPLPERNTTRLLPNAFAALFATLGNDEFGYDFSTDAVVRDWLGARFLHNYDSRLAPRISLPVEESTLPDDLTQAFSESIGVQLGLRNQTTTAQSTGFGISGNSYSNIIEGITISPGETVMAYTHPSGSFLGVDVSGSDVSITPTICVGIQDNQTMKGILFEVTPKSALSSSGGIDSFFVVADLASASVKAYQKVGDSFSELDSSQVTITQLDCP
ncbi:hypothetical protein [Rubellicoccus peritrichatus]|uniref:Uncharacterized protein n=1 Tax=Rubellicoccus peritrichatus TaxID=3080537 RepID=A0AAQ3LA78_9BACT|nr:hypothetical protein [Puniceicoccus sp. CR14]WOO41532.1 hypothetical protein RZN69_00425 [Puniceicoccus sp. CR14]